MFSIETAQLEVLISTAVPLDTIKTLLIQGPDRQDEDRKFLRKSLRISDWFEFAAIHWESLRCIKDLSAMIVIVHGIQPL